MEKLVTKETTFLASGKIIFPEREFPNTTTNWKDQNTFCFVDSKPRGKCECLVKEIPRETSKETWWQWKLEIIPSVLYQKNDENIDRFSSKDFFRKSVNIR